MARTTPGLIAQIEAGALDSKVPLADVLRKCVALGGQAGSEELRDWARRELDGYGSSDELPDYRKVIAPMRLDGANLRWRVRGQQISSAHLPDFARDAYPDTVELTFGIAELEKFAAADDSVQLQTSGMPDLMAYMNANADYGTAIHSIYYSVPAATFHGVLDTIRTNLVALIAEMRAAGVGDRDIPSSPVAEQAVQVVIKGAKRSPINISTAISTGSGQATAAPALPPTESPVPAWVRGPWGVAVGFSSLLGGYAALAAGTGWPPF